MRIANDPPVENHLMPVQGRLRISAMVIPVSAKYVVALPRWIS
tara:strand:+ start:271 stop:399 length:129 start_codon:yes stop_codon:yes gene_type:complete